MLLVYGGLITLYDSIYSLGSEFRKTCLIFKSRKTMNQGEINGFTRKPKMNFLNFLPFVTPYLT